MAHRRVKQSSVNSFQVYRMFIRYYYGYAERGEQKREREKKVATAAHTASAQWLKGLGAMSHPLRSIRGSSVRRWLFCTQISSSSFFPLSIFWDSLYSTVALCCTGRCSYISLSSFNHPDACTLYNISLCVFFPSPSHRERRENRMGNRKKIRSRITTRSNFNHLDGVSLSTYLLFYFFFLFLLFYSFLGI